MKYQVLGAGNMGRAIAYFLSKHGKVKVFDENAFRVSELAAELPIERGYSLLVDTMVSALPAKFNPEYTCRHVPWIDLGGVDIYVEKQKEIKSDAPIIPNVGLAPGLLDMIAYNMVQKQGGKARFVDLFCGGISANADDNSLGWVPTWSVEGLLNNYKLPVDTIWNGKLVKREALSGWHPIDVKNTQYEAFRTHGGYGNLLELLKDSVGYLEYKTLRYPGHIDRVQELAKNYVLLEEIENLAPAKDKVVLRVDVDDQTFEMEIHPLVEDGHAFTAMQVATCVPVMAVARMAAEGYISGKGFVPVETVAWARFVEYCKPYLNLE